MGAAGAAGGVWAYAAVTAAHSRFSARPPITAPAAASTSRSSGPVKVRGCGYQGVAVVKLRWGSFSSIAMSKSAFAPAGAAGRLLVTESTTLPDGVRA